MVKNEKEVALLIYHKTADDLDMWYSLHLNITPESRTTFLVVNLSGDETHTEYDQYEGS